MDIRDKIPAEIYGKGDPVPKRKLVLHIEVTDESTARNILGFVRGHFKNWRRIGKLTFGGAVASYNGGHALHFNHPGWLIIRAGAMIHTIPRPRTWPR